MPDPICSAHPSVSPQEFDRISQEANRVFIAARPVQSEELLSASAERRRQRELCQEVGLCSLGLNDYARRVTDALRPPPGFDHRTFVNIARLFHSSRVSTEEIASLIHLMLDPGRITAFRHRAQQMFLGAGLFYFDYVPHQGAVECFQEGS